jgi:hypothetical protein
MRTASRQNDERDLFWVSERISGKTCRQIASENGTHSEYVMARTNAIKQADCYVSHRAGEAYW